MRWECGAPACDKAAEKGQNQMWRDQQDAGCSIY